MSGAGHDLRAQPPGDPGLAKETASDATGTAGDDLARTLRGSSVRLAVAESLTSGLLASRVGAQPHASDWFAGGVVAYQPETKEAVLGVPHGVDPCSAECAEHLAHGVLHLLHADVAVSTTGIGGPEPQDGHAPGTVFLGWATAAGSGHERHLFEGEPEEVLEQTVDAAMRVLRVLVEQRAR